jgi:hypothetical protein
MTAKEESREQDKNKLHAERKHREEHDAKVGKDPLMEKSIKEIIGDLPKRLLIMVSKLFGVKGFILGATATMSIFGVFGSYTWIVWIVISIFVIFGRDGLKAIKNFRNL